MTTLGTLCLMDNATTDDNRDYAAEKRNSDPNDLNIALHSPNHYCG